MYRTITISLVLLAMTFLALPLLPNRTVDPEGGAWDAYVWVDDANALHAEFAGKGVNVTRGLCDQVYGCRDFEVDDCNGYRLCFGHDLSAPRR